MPLSAPESTNIDGKLMVGQRAAPIGFSRASTAHREFRDDELGARL